MYGQKSKETERVVGLSTWISDTRETEVNFREGRLLLEVILRTVPTNSKVFLRGLLNMREEQILASVIEIQKENWG